MKQERLTQELMNAAHEAARELYSTFFVYRGGSHIAIHRKSGDPLRLCLACDCCNIEPEP